MEDIRLWLKPQIRRRAAVLLGDDWADRCFVETIADEMIAAGITNITVANQAAADDLIVRGSWARTSTTRARWRDERA